MQHVLRQEMHASLDAGLRHGLGQERLRSPRSRASGLRVQGVLPLKAMRADTAGAGVRCSDWNARRRRAPSK